MMAYELGMINLPCGEHGLRFRRPLDVTTAEVDEALGILRRATEASAQKTA